MFKRKAIFSVATVLLLFGCGDGGSKTPTRSTPPPPPPTPSAVVEVTGSGAVTIHPSRNRRFLFAWKFPIRIRETGGGTATWAFFRYSFFKNGREVERYEWTANDIRSAGYSDIAARSDQRFSVTMRSNAKAEEWDGLQLLAGFTDKKDGTVQEREVRLSSFDDIRVDLTPALLPEGQEFSITSP